MAVQGILKGESLKGAAPATTAASWMATMATQRLWAIAHGALSCLALVRALHSYPRGWQGCITAFNGCLRTVRCITVYQPVNPPAARVCLADCMPAWGQCLCSITDAVVVMPDMSKASP